MLEAVPTVSSGRNRRLAPQASHLKGAAGGPIFDFGPFRASEGDPDRPVGAPDPPGGRMVRLNGRGGRWGCSGAGRVPHAAWCVVAGAGAGSGG